jgi:hypothetical protein
LLPSLFSSLIHFSFALHPSEIFVILPFIPHSTFNLAKIRITQRNNNSKELAKNVWFFHEAQADIGLFVCFNFVMGPKW